MAALIGRPPVRLDASRIARALRGKRVMITGAGGSIGSELVLRVAEFAPAAIFLVERAENPLFEIDRRLGWRFPDVPRQALLHDVVDERGTRQMVLECRPDVVFHAAAHKHVPLMEDHPAQAVNNNFFGTRSIADAAIAAGVERFVFISTDKAVNPVSVMGATKRLAELYVRAAQERARKAGERTRFSMVRFGNVLGSACSVLTIWAAQLAEGGPLTVTDPRMTRYFMTLDEAAALVLQAAALDQPPEAPAALYVLDMGRAVGILDLACRFARAMGYAPRVRRGADWNGTVSGEPQDTNDAGRPEIEIVFTGVRPGEKIHEELAYDAESLRPTEHPRIYAWCGREETCDVDTMVADLAGVRFKNDRAGVVRAIARHVPGFSAAHGSRPPGDEPPGVRVVPSCVPVC